MACSVVPPGLVTFLRSVAASSSLKLARRDAPSAVWRASFRALSLSMPSAIAASVRLSINRKKYAGPLPDMAVTTSRSGSLTPISTGWWCSTSAAAAVRGGRCVLLGAALALLLRGERHQAKKARAARSPEARMGPRNAQDGVARLWNVLAATLRVYLF